MIAVSVLDLAPVTEGSDPSRAFANALDLARHAEREARDIEVTVSGSTVRLTGRVDSWAERNVAWGAAWSAPGVTTVINELTVGRG